MGLSDDDQDAIRKYLQPERAMEPKPEPHQNFLHAALAGQYDPPDGYDPGFDALIIETCDDEWVLVPPWRCARPTQGHIPMGQLVLPLAEVAAWARNCHGRELRVWRLRRGKRELEQGG